MITYFLLATSLLTYGSEFWPVMGFTGLSCPYLKKLLGLCRIMQVKGSEIPFTSCHWLLLFTSYGGNVTPGFSRAGPGVLLRLLMKFFNSIRAKLSSWSTVTFNVQNRGLCEDWLLDSRIFGINNCR
ncbi:hypothetical protein RHMOL_Rhmol10G0294400 [Rhododendron molle]|nr:hypothetical protein RHMOL_Rhmol10G0294400 [Rhododendron molle]